MTAALLNAGDRAALWDELTQQQARFVASEARDRHLAQLRAGSPAVVTGQQTGLFLGPAYTIYKAATAIVEARRRGAVPVFWLQAEDHDAEEVSQCAVLDADGEPRSITLMPSGGDRVAMAHRTLGEQVHTALAELADALGEAPHRRACLDLLARAYDPARGWVDAFASVIAELFSAEGLIVFHPRTDVVARLAEPVHRFALERAEALERALVEHAGPKPQVPIRSGCLLSFFHPEGPLGARHRPSRAEEGYAWPGAAPVTLEHLLAVLERSPLSFSTSALLRPLLQDHLFPTVAYIAGPSEARYLEQEPPLYESFGLTMPAIVPRARFVVTDPPCRRRLAELGIAATEVDQPEERLLARLAPTIGAAFGGELRDELLAPLLARLNALEPELSALGKPIAKAAARTRRHVELGIGRFCARVEAAHRRRDEALTGRVAYVRRRLVPSGHPQERALSFPHFAAWFGPIAFKDAVLASVGDERALKELAL